MIARRALRIASATRLPIFPLALLAFRVGTPAWAETSVNTTIPAVHKNRLMTAAVHTYEGALTLQNRESIDALFDGLRFEK